MGVNVVWRQRTAQPAVGIHPDEKIPLKRKPSSHAGNHYVRAIKRVFIWLGLMAEQATETDAINQAVIERGIREQRPADKAITPTASSPARSPCSRTKSAGRTASGGTAGLLQARRNGMKRTGHMREELGRARNGHQRQQE